MYRSCMSIEKLTPCLQRILSCRWLFCIFLLGVGLAGCNSDFITGTSSKSEGKRLVLSTNKVYLSDINSQYTLTAVMTDGEGVAYIDQPIFEWDSASDAVAKVDSHGRITAVGFGETSVTVSGDEQSATVAVVVSDQVSTLSGMVRYEDKEYRANGFLQQADYYKAVRFAQVMLVDQDDQVLQSTYTDQQGRFTISNVLTSQHAIVVVAQTDKTKGLNLNVKDRRDDLYAVTKKISLTALNEFALNISLDNEAAGAFNILDVFTNAAQFTFEVSSVTSASLSAFWQPGNDDGTYYCQRRDSLYCTQGRGVYVYHQHNADTDEFDDDVLYHEYAHYFADDFSKDDSPGGCHLLSSKDLDLRLAWSEGWGDFFPGAVKQWLASDGRGVKIGYMWRVGKGLRNDIKSNHVLSVRFKLRTSLLPCTVDFRLVEVREVVI